MEKKVLLTELTDRGSHLRKEITPTAVVTDEGKHAAGTFWDANKTINEIVAGASSAQDTLKEVEDKLNKEIQDARAAEQAISDRIDDVLGIDAEDIENLKTALEDIDADTGILSVINNKTDKVDSATSGNFAALDSNGNLIDSGHNHSDYITQHQDLSNYVQKSQTTGLLKNNGTVDTNTYLTLHLDISGKANISDISVTSTVDNTNGHDYVEIGGVKWATMNVGATSITDTGLYFQWGDTLGYTASEVGNGSGQKAFKLEDYKYGNATSNPGASGMTKYNLTDNKTVLDASDDAAQAAWGGNWRMPTIEEFQALSAAVNTEWVTNYQGSGVDGRLMTDKTDSSKKLFFPAAGNCYDGSVDNVGSNGNYWMSSLSGFSVEYAYQLLFNSSLVNWQNDYYYRCYGLLVRGVLDGQATSTVTALGKTVTDAEKSAWNAKLDSSALSNYYTKAEIDQLLANL